MLYPYKSFYHNVPKVVKEMQVSSNEMYMDIE